MSNVVDLNEYRKKKSNQLEQRRRLKGTKAMLETIGLAIAISFLLPRLKR